MAYIENQGIDFFPWAVNDTDALKRLRRKTGLDGYAVYLKLLQLIFRSSGYYVLFDEDKAEEFAFEERIDEVLIKKVVWEAIGTGLFNRRLFEDYQVLTSENIQHDFLYATQRRKRIDLFQELFLFGSVSLIFSKNHGVHTEYFIFSIKDRSELLAKIGKEDEGRIGEILSRIGYGSESTQSQSRAGKVFALSGNGVYSESNNLTNESAQGAKSATLSGNGVGVSSYTDTDTETNTDTDIYKENEKEKSPRAPLVSTPPKAADYPADAGGARSNDPQNFQSIMTGSNLELFRQVDKNTTAKQEAERQEENMKIEAEYEAAKQRAREALPELMDYWNQQHPDYPAGKYSNNSANLKRTLGYYSIDKIKIAMDLYYQDAVSSGYCEPAFEDAIQSSNVRSVLTRGSVVQTHGNA